MNNPYEAYLETTVASASPLELVCMLYTGAIEAVRDARRFLADGCIPERSRAISRAVELLAELNGSLDPSAGELAGRLAQLYDYAQRRLLDANFRQTDDGLAEALSILEPLAEAWNSVCHSVAAAEEAPAAIAGPSPDGDITSPWSSVPPPEPQAYGVGSWTL